MDVSPRDARVEDFLNDKLQTLADLDTLDGLLASVHDQQSLLRSQLEAAEFEAEGAEKRTRELSDTILSHAQAFQEEQIAIDSRVIATSASPTIRDAASQIKAQMEKLQRLEIAKGYMSVVLKVHKLSEESRKKINVDPKAALVPYMELQSLFKELKKRHEAADEAAIHLIDFVERTTHELWEDMKARLSEEFQTVYQKLGWPNKDLSVHDNADFEIAFAKLLALSDPDLIPSTTISDGYRTQPSLLPVQVLVKPLEYRFRYHFEGDKQTNRIDKPEWFFNHVISLIEDYAPFVSGNIQPLLDKHLPDTPLDAVHEFITAVLPMLRRKIKNLLPIIVDQAQILSHFIHEMIKFDTSIKEDFLYSPNGQEEHNPWQGLTHEVLVKDDWFRHWLKAEKDFALSRYQSILSADDAWIIDYDSVEPSEAKPTKSAVRLKDLLETITDRYRPLSSFHQRLRFLIDIQISVLDQYHTRLNSSVEAFRIASSALARTLQGTSREEVDQLKGIGGLVKLSIVLGSASYLEKCMRDWGEDVFFLDIWEEVQSRSRNQDPNKEISGQITVQDVADKTSPAVVSGDDDGALFDETAGAYKILQSRAEETVIEHIGESISEELKAYSRITLWSSISPQKDQEALFSLSVSPEMVQPISSLDSYFSYLTRTLTPSAFRRIFRSALLSVQTYLLDYVVNRNQFSESGGRQLARDCAEIWNAAGKYVADAETSTRKLKEACILLALPGSSTVPDQVDNEGDPWDQGEDVKLAGKESEILSVKFVVDNIFKDDRKAKDILEQLGIATLSLPDVKGILRRRVDAWA